MPRSSVLARNARLEPVATTSADAEPALSVAVLYQDLLARDWTTELWDRVGQAIGSGGIRTQSWRMSDLAHPDVFAGAVRAAAEADVVVVSLRDAQELPLNLYVWIESWLPIRSGRPGALVALIGVPARPDAQSGKTYRFLEAVARRASLDFLPREHKLPEDSFALASLANAALTPNPAIVSPTGGLNGTPDGCLHWKLAE